MKFFLFLTLILLVSCVKSKSILICGDHECINKTEAKQYFDENLTIEVKIISKNKESRFDLVSLNMENNDEEKNSIQVFKNNNNKVIKKLSKKEISKKKKEIKAKKKIAKLDKKDILKKEQKKKFKENRKVVNIDKSPDVKNTDICLMVKKCDIDSITTYLIKLSNAKEYPNINLRN